MTAQGATLAAMVPLLLLGATAPAAAPGVTAPQPEMVRPDSSLLGRGFVVREALPGSGDTVLVISDVHDSTITGATLAGFTALHSAFPFDVAGFENYDHDFRNRREGERRGGPVNAALVAMLNSVDPALTDWARDRVLRRGTSRGKEVTRYRDGHIATTFGIERSDSSMLFVRVAFVQGELLAELERVWSDSAGTLAESLRDRGLAVLGNFIAAADPGVPRLPPGTVRGESGRAVLRRVIGDFLEWLNGYVLDDRNRGFAASVVRELKLRNATRAVVLVGFAHTVRGGRWPSLQERLRESGMTVIVADPPAVREWLEQHASLIRH